MSSNCLPGWANWYTLDGLENIYFRISTPHTVHTLQRFHGLSGMGHTFTPVRINVDEDAVNPVLQLFAVV